MDINNFGRNSFIGATGLIERIKAKEIQMRPYRAIPIDGKDFVYGWYSESWTASSGYKSVGSHIRWLEENNDFQEVEVIPGTVGQFTGLKDKSGKEIYEGDIVKGIWQCDKTTIRIGAVNYWEKFGLYGIEDKSALVSVVWKGCEIIGNIHQNPKLLEQDNESKNT